MEKNQNFPSHAGISGKALIASLFIISGVLLLARNVGWITPELFSLIVSWHSLLIVLGIYSMARCHYISGITLALIGVYFLIGGLSWLPALIDGVASIGWGYEEYWPAAKRLVSEVGG